jgi:RNA polymerase sigma factor (sigma-70 family)
MPEPAKVVTSDAEIDAAIRQARAFSRYDQRVARAAYSPRTDRFSLRMENGVTHSIPRRLLQGLAYATAAQLSHIELLGHGTGLFWPILNVAHSVSGLLAGVYGSGAWMDSLIRKNPKSQSAKQGMGTAQTQVDDDQLFAGLRGILEDTIADAILRLPYKERLVLNLFYGQKMSVGEISFHAGLSESRVRELLSFARERVISPLRGICPETTSKEKSIRHDPKSRRIRP